MARQLKAVFELEGKLKCDTALCVAHGDSGMTDDIVCLRDGQGRLIIPGTALAGVLRHQLGKNKKWGDDHDPADPLPPRPAQDTWGSSVWVEDSVMTSPQQGHTLTMERRDGVGIDRVTGTAETGVLYSREVVPANTQFDVRITVEQPAADQGDEARDLFVAVVTLLKAGISVGGATSRGLGRITLQGTPRLECRKVDTKKSMIALLRGGHGQKVDVNGRSRNSRTSIEVPWRPTGPLLVMAAANGLADGVPLATESGGEVRFVIPGSSIKGVLRARAERILRTLSPDSQNPDLRLAEALFGSAPIQKSDGNRGALTVFDCHSFAVGMWADLMRSVEVARSDDPKRQIINARDKAKRSRVELLDHVSLDRWSGGSDDGRLFSLIAPLAPAGGGQGVQWNPIRMELDSRRLPQKAETVGDPRVPSFETALALLALVLRDFADGELPLGHGTTRGYGEISGKVEDMKVASAESSFKSIGQLLASPEGNSAEFVSKVQTAWAAFADSFVLGERQEEHSA